MELKNALNLLVQQLMIQLFTDHHMRVAIKNRKINLRELQIIIKQIQMISKFAHMAQLPANRIFNLSHLETPNIDQT